MKKLLLIGSNSIHTFNFFNLIKDYFAEIVLVTNQPHSFEDEKLKASYAVYSSLKNPLNYCKAIKSYQEILVREKPDIIHIQQISTYSMMLLKALKKAGMRIPVVLTTWGSDILVVPDKNIILKKMVQYVLNNADYFTTDATFVAERMQSLANKPLHTIIANFGINVADIPIQKENVVYSNRLHKPLYQIDKIIIAFSKFAKQNPDWKLVIGATGSETENLKQLCQTLDLESRVDFVGWLDAKANSENYAKAKIWVSIPESDGTSISLLEAMSFGCIPIVSDLPANREWIENGKNGVIVSDSDQDFITEATALNFDSVFEINREIINQKGTKAVNKALFCQIYDEVFKAN